MYILSKLNLMLVLSIFSFTSLMSQDSANYSANKDRMSNSDNSTKSNDDPGNFYGLSISFNYGYTQFDGDIRQYDYFSSKQTGNSYQDSDFKELRTAYSFSLEKKIDQKFSVSTDYVKGEFAGLRRPNEYIGYEIDYPYPDIINESSPNGQKFVTTFNEIDLLLHYDLNSDISKLINVEMPENISIIAKLGFGYNSFRSLRTNLYTDDYVYSYGYEDFTKNEVEMVSESVIIYGTKIKYEIQDGISLLLDYTVRNNMSDKWDSSIMDGGQGSDRFSLCSLGVAYDL